VSTPPTNGQFKMMRSQVFTRDNKSFAFPTMAEASTGNWGCDCWLPDKSQATTPPKQIMAMLFGRNQPRCERIVRESETYRLYVVDKTRGPSHILTSTGQYWSVYEGKDCHIGTGDSLLLGHIMVERIVLRLRANEVLVARCDPVTGFQHLEVDADHHARLGIVRSIQYFEQQKDHEEPLSQPIQLPRNTEMVLMGDQWVDRETKQRLRRERRARNADLRAQNLPVKRYRMPIRFQGLTTQEYHEVVLREQEDLKIWVDTHGLKSWPQDVRDWLKSKSGSLMWNRAHAFAVDRRDFALRQLDEINKQLKYKFGLLVPLKLNEDLVVHLRRKKIKLVAERRRQIDAKTKNASKYEAAHWSKEQLISNMGRKHVDIKDPDLSVVEDRTSAEHQAAISQIKRWETDREDTPDENLFDRGGSDLVMFKTTKADRQLVDDSDFCV